MYDTYGPIKNGSTYTFTVHAPNASQVILKLNSVDRPMTKVGGDFVVAAPASHMDTYSYVIDGVEKFDPFARYIQDGLVSTVYESSYEFVNQRQLNPVNSNSKILEVYLPYVSGNTYAEKAADLISRFQAGNYTHLSIMPLHHHWYIGSLGYHPQGFYAPSWFFGEPDSLKQMIDLLHGAGITVILDFVMWEHTETPEGNGLSLYDGTNLYEKTHLQISGFGGIYLDFEKQYIKDFIKNALKFWVEEYQFDGFRFDGINEIIFNVFHEVKSEAVAAINYILDGLDAEIILEIITEKTLQEVGLNYGKVEGSLLSFLLLSYLEDNAIENKPFLDQHITSNKINDLIAIHHDLFMNGLTTMNLYEESRKQNLDFIIKLLYAARKSKIVFGHIDVYSQELSDSVHNFFEQVDAVWSDEATFSALQTSYIIAHGDKSFVFNLETKQVTIV